MTVIKMSRSKAKEVKQVEIELDQPGMKRQVKEIKPPKMVRNDSEYEQTATKMVRILNMMMDYVMTLFILNVIFSNTAEHFDIMSKEKDVSKRLLENYYRICQPFMLFSNPNLPFAARVITCFFKLYYTIPKMQKFLLCPQVKAKTQIAIFLLVVLWMMPFFVEYCRIGRLSFALWCGLISLLTVALYTVLVVVRQCFASLMWCAIVSSGILPLALYVDFLCLTSICVAIHFRYEGDKASKIFFGRMLFGDISNKILRGFILESIRGISGIYRSFYDMFTLFCTAMVFAHCYLVTHRHHAKADIATMLAFFFYYSHITNCVYNLKL